MAKRLKTLARIINESGKFTAEIVEGYCNTDRKIGRLRIEGKGRTGWKIIIKDLSGGVVKTHNSAETYRSNDEVEYWMANNGIEF